MWNIQTSKIVSNMAHEVLCTRNISREIATRAYVVLRHELTSENCSKYMVIRKREYNQIISFRFPLA